VDLTTGTAGIHPDRIAQIKALESDQEDLNFSDIDESRGIDSESSSISEDQLHDQVLENCGEFWLQSELARKVLARCSFTVSKQQSSRLTSRVAGKKAKSKKIYTQQTDNIVKSELD
jgi:hypothetical protein